MLGMMQEKPQTVIEQMVTQITWGGGDMETGEYYGDEPEYSEVTLVEAVDDCAEIVIPSMFPNRAAIEAALRNGESIIGGMGEYCMNGGGI